MEPSLRSVTWEAPEHHHIEKGNDWFFALIIIVVALVIVAILFNNLLFALLIGVAGLTLLISAAKKPALITYSINLRGVKISDRMYPFSSLESYRIDEEDYKGPQLLLKSAKLMMPLMVMPIPPEHIDDIDDILKQNLEEEDLEEPLIVKVLELFGF
jgi:hypothetical protein